MILDLLPRRYAEHLRTLPKPDDARIELATTVLRSAGEISAADLTAAIGGRRKEATAALNEIVARAEPEQLGRRRVPALDRRLAAGPAPSIEYRGKPLKGRFQPVSVVNPADTISAVLTMGEQSRFQAFDHSGLLARAAPFLGAMWLAIMAFPLPPEVETSPVLVAAVLLNALIVLGAVATPWNRLPHFAQIAPPLAYFLVIALLREADGGSASAYAVLVMLPVFWLALYGSLDQLAVSIVGVVAVFIVPVLVAGSPKYPPSEWTRALLWICVAPIVGFTVQALVRQLRDRAAENLKRAEELQVSQEESRKLVVSMAAVTEATRESPGRPTRRSRGRSSARRPARSPAPTSPS